MENFREVFSICHRNMHLPEQDIQPQKIWLMFLAVFFVLMFLGGRLVYLMVFCSEYYGQKAEDLHERERDIKAARGRIIDATGKMPCDEQIGHVPFP